MCSHMQAIKMATAAGTSAQQCTNKKEKMTGEDVPEMGSKLPVTKEQT